MDAHIVDIEKNYPSYKALLYYILLYTINNQVGMNDKKL